MKISKDEILKKANESCKDSLMETLHIEFVDAGDDFVIAKMPVTKRVHQPDGVLHGGATVALAETVKLCFSYISRYGYVFCTGYRCLCKTRKKCQRRICACQSNLYSYWQNHADF